MIAQSSTSQPLWIQILQVRRLLFESLLSNCAAAPPEQRAFLMSVKKVRNELSQDIDNEYRQDAEDRRLRREKGKVKADELKQQV